MESARCAEPSNSDYIDGVASSWEAGSIAETGCCLCDAAQREQRVSDARMCVSEGVALSGMLNEAGRRIHGRSGPRPTYLSRSLRTRSREACGGAQKVPAPVSLNAGGNGRSTLAGERRWGSHRHRITAAYRAAARPVGSRLAGAGREKYP